MLVLRMHCTVIGDHNKVNICLKLAEKFSTNSKQIDKLKKEIASIKPMALNGGAGHGRKEREGGLIEATGNLILLLWG